MAESVFYFSNGTEGQMWQAEWCDRCRFDHACHSPEPDYDNGCPHIVSMVLGLADEAFIRLPNDRGYDDLHCTKFMRCSCDNGPDDPGVDPPPPPDPNQGLLFDVDALAPGVWRDVVLDELTLEPVP